MTEHQRWAPLVKQISSVGHRLLDHKASPLIAPRTQTLACSLLARTLGNFSGSMLLLRDAYVVEARALVRCCLENDFFLADLAADPEAFWTKLQEDDAKQRQMKGKQFFETDRLDKNLAERLREWMKKSLTEFPKAKKIIPKAMAKDNMTYVAYSQFSSDAGHASLTSLQRHVKRDQEGVPHFVAVPDIDAEEVISTYKWGCLIVIRSCGRVDELIGKPEDGRIRDTVEKFGALLAD